MAYPEQAKRQEGWVDYWHNWRQCPPPPDLVKEIEEIARHRQVKPRVIVWQLVREALAARRRGAAAGR
jgi:hypothetical protein